MLRRLRILRRDGYICQSCRKPEIEPRLEVDHIIPLSQGGKDIDSNLQTLCEVCHAAKTQREQKMFNPIVKD